MISPCTRVCKIDPGSGYCIGCLRNIKEIASWSNFSESMRESIVLELQKRRVKQEHE
ncbi:MAG: DUF1289 domain-containing protein [Leptospiraceae bacterium]|nr:DUF1289 domain-containing protein [Leptospiraceae bacterium]MCP5513069.1 DUF1289 domain-containing protein [Leptospiraceae bacterium]